MDHLEGANYRDYSTAPKRRHRSEISNGGTAEAAAEEPKEAAAPVEQVENTAQSSELMAETLRRLYAEKPEEKAEEAVAEAGEAVTEAAEEAVEEVKETAEEVKSAADEAAGTRRRRARKTE